MLEHGIHLPNTCSRGRKQEARNLHLISTLLIGARTERLLTPVGSCRSILVLLIMVAYQ